MNIISFYKERFRPYRFLLINSLVIAIVGGAVGALIILTVLFLEGY